MVRLDAASFMVVKVIDGGARTRDGGEGKHDSRVRERNDGGCQLLQGFDSMIRTRWWWLALRPHWRRFHHGWRRLDLRDEESHEEEREPRKEKENEAEERGQRWWPSQAESGRPKERVSGWLRRP
ncbi:hypothetical protein RIF29_27609 [Crotalaria pallida]|uniref:Uncharacterized protein n=1 Tax=Crotalaria pallida TaxID=3830 RepID=A0AAN9EU91_CROPI